MHHRLLSTKAIIVKYKFDFNMKRNKWSALDVTFYFQIDGGCDLIQKVIIMS